MHICTSAYLHIEKMNFLSHFYFDQDVRDPYFILGIALPDLVKNFNRTWNMHPHKNSYKWADDNLLNAIEQGWNKHLSVDYYFHNSDYFTTRTALIKEHIQKVKFDNPLIRPFILAHIGLEIVLDTLLIKNGNVSVERFYKHLHEVEKDPVIRFLKMNNIQEPEQFLPFYERFSTVQYLFSYKNNESVVYALNRINFRIWNSYFSDNEVIELQEHFAEIIEIIEKDYMIIFDEISEKTKLNA
jgi:hypothetical protein